MLGETCIITNIQNTEMIPNRTASLVEILYLKMLRAIEEFNKCQGVSYFNYNTYNCIRILN